MTNSSGPDGAHLSLVVRSSEGNDTTERRLLDVSEMTTDPDLVRAAARAAWLGVGLRMGEDDELPVFDLRAASVAGGTAADRAQEPAAGTTGGCLLIGSRGPLRVALLVD